MAAQWRRASAVAAAKAGATGLTVQGLPIVKPPYGRITALDLNKGEMVWQIAHGDTPDNIKNSPALKGITLPRLGRQGRIGVLTTKTLVIAGEGGFVMEPNGQRGAMLRAAVTFRRRARTPARCSCRPPQTGSPMTYTLNGRLDTIVSLSISGNGAAGADHGVHELPNRFSSSLQRFDSHTGGSWLNFRDRPFFFLWSLSGIDQ